MNYVGLLPVVKAHQQSFFLSQPGDVFVYHDLQHTQKVAAAAEQMAHHYHLNERDFFVVTTAAWFHDAGYYVDAQNHEQKGAELAADFLRKQGLSEGDIDAVAKCILATRMPQNPTNLLEEIVCDADLFHLGTEEFGNNNKKMRRELEARTGNSISKEEWRRNSIQLLQTHHYFTGYSKNLLNDTKQAHLEKLLRKSEKTAAEKTELPTATSDTTEGKKKPARGIETMFRITSNNNQRLSDMADNKAQIMITVNSIILSAVLSILLRKLEEYSYLAWPTYLILGVSVCTIIFSILATRPHLLPGTFSQKDIDQKKVNLLFFGNFYKMHLEDYAAGMREVMNDRDFLYGTLIRDVYAQGVVLGRKYRLLRISYNIFMYGLILSVLAFVIASAFAAK
jgi:predicted metal-dependent HD superfamily phosphohydrolase